VPETTTPRPDDQPLRTMDWPAPPRPLPLIVLACPNEDCATHGWHREVRLEYVAVGVLAAGGPYQCEYCRTPLVQVSTP